MSDLQIGLLAVGGVVVAAVLVFNWIQERRFRKQADAAFRTPAGDALMQGGVPAQDSRERVEPSLDERAFDADDADVHVQLSGAVPATPVEAAPSGRAEPAPAAAQPSRTSAQAPAAPAAPYDELIEYRARIGGEGVVASALAGAYSQTRALGKAVRWAGLPAGMSAWEEFQPWRDVRYQQLVVTMQLADRNGAVQEEQLAALCDVLQTAAQANGLRLACDDMVDALERAQAIDRFCVDVDVLIGLNVVARGEGAVNLARIVHEAETSGMALGADGVFQLLDSRGEPLYALCNHDAEPFVAGMVEGQTSQGVTLQFDVPRVPDGLKVFDGMVAFGRRLANEVGGILVDDNLRPLTDAGIEKIRSQLQQIYERMEARGVPSGSRRSLRLFS
ncbi:cell division protein ZipA C-terminal FtsZ-binding domain-containing protein [Thiobacillus sedimenti]|uniref:Cell division protein ZipA n=1 Tax=Thiobacillus sedimenti TaxID=3110231 RepID=A0ABZ1CLQ6_9PROT|nr:cell division protein ZipA C-terminal FtsZ-binding domain-containing protein [Thiobacillus sp. SCUT-2]WRS39938.1 cell division protein ZipA C-terminal FtsZ-binding domain-containing protein [Thiobacillus sp. SCUT-2]